MGISRKQSDKKMRWTVCIWLCALVIFLTACQPTPEVPPLANRAGGLPEDAIIDAIPDDEIKEIDAPAHWAEHMERRGGRITIDADVDVKVPETSNTPILELAQTELTQERLIELVRYFAGSKKLYQMSGPTKSELEAELQKMKNREGIYAAYYYDDSLLEKKTRAEEMIETAPVTAEKEHVDVAFYRPEQNAFGYILSGPDENIERLTGETEFGAGIEDENDTRKASVSATRYDEASGTSSRFAYGRGRIYTEENYRQDKNDFDKIASWVGTNIELLGKIDEDWLKRNLDWLDEFERKTQSIGLDQNLAQKQAEQVLSDLGIEDMGLAEVEKGIQIVDEAPGLFLETAEYDLGSAKMGYEFKYFRMLDGIPARILYNGSIYVGTMADVPVSPAFHPEYISIFVTDEGVQDFTWENMAHVVSSVVENTKLLPFEEIKEKFADMLNFYTMPGEDVTYQNNVYNVELRAAYMPAFGDPSHAWLVPAWVFEYDQYWTTEDEYLSSGIQFQMSAVDGGYIMASYGSVGYD